MIYFDPSFQHGDVDNDRGAVNNLLPIKGTIYLSDRAPKSDN